MVLYAPIVPSNDCSLKFHYTMTFNLTILYPNRDDIKFNMQYYLHTHMPLVERDWSPAGLLKWDVTEYALSVDGQKPAYYAGNTMIWKDEMSYIAAFKGPASAGIFGDIPNFCNYQPIIISGNVVASGIHQE